MVTAEAIVASKAIARTLSKPCYEMVADGVPARLVMMGLVFVAFDLALDELSDERATRDVFLTVCSALTRFRLLELGVPGAADD